MAVTHLKDVILRWLGETVHEDENVLSPEYFQPNSAAKFFLDSHPAAISINAIDGRNLFHNEAWRQLTELFSDQGHYADICEQSSGPLDPETGNRHREVLATQKSLTFEQKIQNQDGQIHVREVTKFPLFDSDNQFVGIATISTDKTKQIEMESKFRNLVEGSIQGIYIHRAWRLLFANKSMATMLGYRDVNEFLDLKDAEKIVAPQEIDRLRKFREARERQEDVPPRHEAQYLKKDGTHIWLESINNLVSWHGGPAVQSTVIDITERKLLEEQTRRAEKMDAVGQLTGGVAHDFNNILGIIQGNLELLQEMLPADKKSLKRVERALKGVDRGTDITRKLLGFSGRVSQQVTVTSVEDFLKKFEEGIEGVLSPTLQFEIRPAADLWPICIDQADFKDALLNLLMNAQDAMTGGGNLTIEAKNKVLDHEYARLHKGARSGDFVMISVIDSGIGMTPEVKEKSLDPFFTTKDPGTGTGLGLSTVYGFVERSSGHMNMYSEVKKGTSIQIFLPRTHLQTDVAETITPSPEDDLQGTETILIVDDEIDLRDIAVAHLCSCGYKTVVAKDGDEALAILSDRSDIDLLFSDVVMPGGLDGFQLALAAQHLIPDLKVLLTSGFTRKRDRILSEEDEYMTELNRELLNKPYNKSELVVTIRNILDK